MAKGSVQPHDGFKALHFIPILFLRKLLPFML